MPSLFRFFLYLPIRNEVKQEAFLRRFFENKLISVVHNNRGQAVIEYILLLVIVVSLVLGLRGVFGAMNTFMSDMIGGYVSCLMEYGELPALGVEESDLKQHKEGDGKRCPLPTFSAAAAFGGGSTGGTGGTGGATGGGSGNGSNNGKNGNNGRGGSNASKSGNQSNQSADAEDSSRGNGSGSKSRTAARGRGSSPYSRGQISRTGSAATADNPQDLNDTPKVKAIAGAEEESGGAGDLAGGRRGSRRASPVRPKYKALTGKMAEDVQKSVRIARKPGSTLLAVDEGYRMTVVKRNFTPPEVKPPPEEKPEEGFSFGNFLKWIIIAGIIIACVILFGGQVLNYSNSDS